MSNICIIPARGGSKRIPRKNVKYFLGKPIIAYSIEIALKSNLFDEVMVSTDDLEIAEIAKMFGAKVPRLRSDENSNDFATTFEVIEEVINSYKQEGIQFDNICCIYACAPFVTQKFLTESFYNLTTHHFDTVFPVLEYSYPIQRALKTNGNKVEMFNSEHLSSRSQDLEKSFHDAGQFYWMKTNVVLNKKTLFTENSGYLLISELEGQDIDNETDWKLAELKYKLLND
jgi:pseudaminic acid cytidylyltransferase